MKNVTINENQSITFKPRKNCKTNSKIGLLATEGTLKTKVYDKIFNKNFELFFPNNKLQKQSVNKANCLLNL